VIVVFVTLAVLFVAVVAGVLVLVRRGSGQSVEAVGDGRHRSMRDYERAVHDARTVHNAAAMGDQYHR
jgi:hypothetical protein